MPTYDLPSSFDFDDPRVQVAIEKITKRGTRVSGADVSQSRTLHFIAEWYAARYDGRFDYMRQMRELINAGRDLSVNQMAGVINCLVHDASKRKPSKLEEIPADLPAVESPATCEAFRCNAIAVREGFCADHARKNLEPLSNDRAEMNADYPLDPIGARRYNEDRYDHLLPGEQLGADTPLPLRETITPIVCNGTYTVVLNERGDYRTLRVESAKNKPEGTQVVGFLSGPNNERDFTDFAWLSGQTIGVWSRYRGDSLSMTALEKLVYAGDDTRADYGTAYAIESGRCCKCGRKLTVPASLFRGMGPECSKKAG